MTTGICLILVRFVIFFSSIASNHVCSMLHLDDGTQVVLSTCSVLIYPNHPKTYNYRYVRLIGKGVFIVGPLELWFVLHLDNVLVKTKEASFVVTTMVINGKEIQHVQIKSGKVEIAYGQLYDPSIVNT